MTSVRSSALPIACLRAPAPGSSSDALLATLRGDNEEDLVPAAADESHHPRILAVNDESEGGGPVGDPADTPTTELVIAVAPDVAVPASDAPTPSKRIMDLITSLLCPVTCIIVILSSWLLIAPPIPLPRPHDVPAFALALLAVFLCYGLRDESDDRLPSVLRQMADVLGETARAGS